MFLSAYPTFCLPFPYAEASSFLFLYDRAGERILNGSDGTDDCRLDGRFLKCQIGIGRKRAVLQNQVLTIAERLRAGDTAADEAEVLGVPTEVFAFEFGVIDGNVFAIPERIFGIKDGMMDFDVFCVLECIFALQPKLADT